MTTYSKTIGTGGDFVNLAAWESARLAASESISGDTEEAVLLDGIYNTNFFGLNSNWPDGIKIRITAQNPHKGDWNVSSGGVILSAISNANVFYIPSFNAGSSVTVELDNLVLMGSKDLSYPRVIVSDCSGTVRLLNCLATAQNSGGDSVYVQAVGVTKNLYVENCVLTKLGGGYGINHPWTASSVMNLSCAGSFINNLFLGGNTGQQNYVNLSAVLLSGSILGSPTYGFAVDSIKSTAWTGWTTTHCSAATFVDGAPSAGQVGFTNISALDFSLYDSSSNLAKNFVISIDLPERDIVGTVRPQGQYADAGAFEIREPVTTVLNYYESNVNIGARHVHFNLRDSVPNTGDVDNVDAAGEFRVVRNGEIIKRENDILDFAWLGQNGDKVYARYTSKDGTHGEWVSYEYVVTGTYGANHYFDLTFTGTPDGSISSPYNHIDYLSAVNASMTSGVVHAIWLKEGQTFSSIQGNTINNEGSYSKSGVLRFLRWGDTEGVNKPILNYNSSSTSNWFIRTGQADSYQFSSIDIQLGISGSTVYPTSATNFLLHNRSTNTASAAVSYNFLMDNCEVSGGRNVLYFQNNRLNFSSWDYDDGKFVAIKDTTFINDEPATTNTFWVEFGRNSKYIYFDGFHLSVRGPIRPGNNPQRGMGFKGWQDCYLEDFSATTTYLSGGAATEMLIYCSDYDSDVYGRSINQSNNNVTINRGYFVKTGWIFTVAFSYTTGRLGNYYNHTFINSFFYDHNSIVFGVNANNNSVNTNNIFIKKCSMIAATHFNFINQSSGAAITYPTASGSHSGIYLYDNNFEALNNGGNYIYGVGSYTGGFASSCYHFRGNIFSYEVWLGGGLTRPVFLAHYAMSPYEIVQKIGEERNNLWAGPRNSSTWDIGTFYYYGTASVSTPGQPLVSNLTPKGGRDYALSALGKVIQNPQYYSGVDGDSNVPNYINKNWLTASSLNDSSLLSSLDFRLSSTSSPAYHRGFLKNDYSFDGDDKLRGETYTDIGRYQLDINVNLVDDPELPSVNPQTFTIPLAISVLLVT